MGNSNSDLAKDIQLFLSDLGFQVEQNEFQEIKSTKAYKTLEGNSKLSLLVQSSGDKFKIDVDYFFHNIITHSIVDSLWAEGFDEFKKIFLNLNIVRRLVA